MTVFAVAAVIWFVVLVAAVFFTRSIGRAIVTALLWTAIGTPILIALSHR